ncbi:Beta-1,3-galactosyltransferase 1 [Liparis tanakae]|uniref:Hexosyltransferase n=1 Tax=Liparis tanakae TaxID=230148 RepID=A0A4Z2F2R5_9TELE|nr:Beta-1,3-galactosyltransferase 1 [Liparis tanakae]
MRRTFLCRFVKLLAITAAAALALSAHALLSRAKPKPRALSAEEYRLIAPETYEYVLNQPAACGPAAPFLVLMVPVGPLETAAREAVRSTWGAPGRDTLTLFYLGLPEGGRDSSAQRALEEESSARGDIIQADFRDTYQNLTIKTMLMMSWLATHCPNASYVMKVDADSFVNVAHLLGRLRRAPGRSFITGSVIRDGRPRRDRRSKWRVSEEQYPDGRFPPYVSGAGYVFSGDLAARISRASRFVRVIPLEDVYVGLCLRVLGVQPVYSLGLPTFRNLFEVRHLDYDRCAFARLVLANGFRPRQLLRMWRDFSRGRGRC